MNLSDYYLTPHVKSFILRFVRDRKCQLHYGVDQDGNKLPSRFFMLHEGNYDRRMKTKHVKYKSHPIGMHVTPSRYVLYPVRAEGEYAVDLVLDIDGDSYEQNHAVAHRIIQFFHNNNLYSFFVWRSHGNHDGIQMKVPFECFCDKITITEADIIEIKNFYLKLTWILNKIITRDNIIELKMYRTTFRVPLTFNETTKNFCNIIYREDDVEYLSGEELMARVNALYYDTKFYKRMTTEIKFLKVYKRKVARKKYRVKYNHVDPKDFPSCFKTGMFVKSKEHVNHEMIIFAFWCFAKQIGWSDESITDYLLRWKSACRIKEDMLPHIKEKHKNRSLSPISCAYIINQAKFCIGKCGKSNPFEGLNQ